MRPCSLPVRRALLLLTLLFLALVSISHAAQWHSIGPEGAWIQDLTSGAGGTLYAVTGRGNVVASSDGAASWSSRGKNGSFYGRLEADPARPGVLWASNVGGLFKSVDGGTTWSGSLRVGFLWAFQIAPSSPDVLYAARNQAIFKSTDGGASWASTSFAGTAAFALAVDPSNPLVVYAGTPDGVQRSDDGGATWTALPSSRGISSGDLAIDPRQPSTLYELSGDEVLKSTDRGTSWSSVWKAPVGSYILPQRLTVDPGSGTVYMLDYYTGIYSSPDGGASWARILSLYGVSGLALDQQTPGRLYMGTVAGGVYRSDDRGGTWAVANHGLRELGFLAVAADPHAPGVLFAIANPYPQNYLAFSPQFLLRSTDGGATWSSPFGDPNNSPFSNAIVPDPSRPGTWYLATNAWALKTRDGGQTWEKANQGLRLPEFVYALAVAPSSPDTLYAIGWDSFPLCNSPNCPRVVLFRSMDGGAQWRRARAPGLEHGDVLSSLAVDAVNPAIVYAGGPRIYKSTDGGVSWSQTAGSLRGSILGLAADPFTSGTLYASVYVPRGRRVYKSTDGGATWKPASGGLSVVGVGRIVPDPRTPGTLYAATGRGVYVTRNGGALWTPMNEGWSEGSVWSLALDPLRPGVLYAGRDDGLFEYSSDSSAPAAAH